MDGCVNCVVNRCKRFFAEELQMNEREKKGISDAGNRTRASCVKGRNPNH